MSDAQKPTFRMPPGRRDSKAAKKTPMPTSDHDSTPQQGTTSSVAPKLTKKLLEEIGFHQLRILELQAAVTKLTD